MNWSAAVRSLAAGWLATFVLAQQVAAQTEIGVTDLVCETRGGLSQTFPVETDPISTRQTKAYHADEESEKIIFSPSSARQLPNSVVKLQFALACLQLIEGREDVCAAVNFLSYQGAIKKEEITELENYYIELAERSPDEADKAYSTIKEVFACF